VCTCASEEDEEGAAEKAALSTRAKKIIGLGRTYGYTMNMFISAKECTPSKVASCYDPVWRFGTHRGEGHFCEFVEWLPEEFEEDLRRWHEFFRQHVEYLHYLDPKKKPLTYHVVHTWGRRGQVLWLEYIEVRWYSGHLPILLE